MAGWGLALLILGISGVSALYEDQAGTFDWYKSYVGYVRSASFHRSKPRLFLSTQQGVAAALNLRDGSIAFRHKQAEPTTSLLVDQPAVFVTLAGSTLSGWDQTEGVLKWTVEVPLSTGTPQAALALVPGVNPQLAVLSDGRISLFDALTGTQRGEVTDTQLLASTGSISQWFLHATSPTGVSAYSFTPGSSEVYFATQTEAATPLEASLPLSATAAVGPAGFAVLSQDFRSICTTGLAGGALTCTQLQGLGPGPGFRNSGPATHLVATAEGWALATGDSEHPSAVLLKSSSEGVSVISLWSHASAVSRPLNGAAGQHLAVVQVTPSTGAVLVQYVSTTTGVEVASEGPITGARSDKLAPGVIGPSVQAAVMGSYKKRDQSEGYRVLLVWSDKRITLLQQGVVVWTRDEALAGVTSASFAELPPAMTVATGTDAPPNLKAQFMQFLRMQMLSAKVQFKIALPEEVAEFTQLRAELSDKQLPHRDSRGFRRSIIVTTASGKVAALHNGDGRVIWARPGAVGATAPQRLLAWRTYHDLAHAPQMATLATPKQGSGGTQLQVLDTYTGKEITAATLAYRVDKLVPLGAVAEVGEHFDQQLYLAVSLNGDRTPPSVHLLPDTPHARSYFAATYRSIHFWLDETKGIEATRLVGYGFDLVASTAIAAGQPATAATVWTVAVPESRLAVEATDPWAPVHTAAKVLGDRSMKYRYLNPNTLVLVTGLAPGVVVPADERDFIAATIHVIDTVTGSVLHQQSVPGARGPAAAVISENLVAVQLWDASSGRHAITSLELYDASDRHFSVLDHLFNPNATKPQSSYDPVPLEVLSASFFTRTPAKSLSTTATRVGITSKLLLALTATDQVYGLDIRFIDPRRPHRAKLTPEEQEERLIPYQDSLPLMAPLFVTFNKQVLGLSNVLAAPARLESTSLLFAWGVDLQYTRLAPAKGFDSLDDDFSYGLLIVALVTLSTASIFMHWYIKQKMVKAKWQ